MRQEDERRADWLRNLPASGEPWAQPQNIWVSASPLRPVGQSAFLPLQGIIHGLEPAG